MTADVFTLPTAMDRLIDKLRNLLQREASNRSDWIQIQLDKCQTVLDMRNQYPVNIEFGRWWKVSEFASIINSDTRAAMITMAREPEALRKCLEATERNSLHVIYSHEFVRLRNVSKTDNAKGDHSKGHKPDTPQTDQAYEEIIKAQSEGREIPAKKEFAKAIGVSHTAVEKALDRIRQEQEQAGAVKEKEDRLLTTTQFSDKGKFRIEDAIRIHIARLNKQFEQRVREEVRRQIDAADNFTREENKRLRSENAGLQRILSQRALLTPAEFNVLRKCLHEDRIMRFGDAEMIKEFSAAAQLLNEKKKSLIGTD